MHLCDQSKILSFGKELLVHIFYLIPLRHVLIISIIDQAMNPDEEYPTIFLGKRATLSFTHVY